VAYDRPLPKPNSDTKPFWEGCQRHQLRFQKCCHCDHIRWPPSVICPNCHSSDAVWIVASGKGMIYSYVVYHVAFHPAFKSDLPYVTAVVKLTEGPCILTNIVGCRPSEIKCDIPVMVVWDDSIQGFSIPKFKPINNPTLPGGAGKKE